NVWIQGELAASPNTWKLRASDEVSTPPPAAPSGLTAKAPVYSTVVLTWTDRSNGEQGFKIERKGSSGDFKQIGTVGTNATTYKDTGLTGNTEYIYRVRAYLGGLNSDYSNEADVTTPPPPPNAPSNLVARPVS